MYAVKNQLVERAIESYSPLYGVYLKSLSNGKIYAGDCLFSAATDVWSTTLSDDIELGAVCSQSLSVKMTGIKGVKFLGEDFKLYIGLKNGKSQRTTYGDLCSYQFDFLNKETIENVYVLGNVICGEFIPMGSFTCVKHKLNGDVSELELYDKLYFSNDIYSSKVALPASSRDIENDICSQLKCENGNSYAASSYLLDSDSSSLLDKNGKKLKTKSFAFTISQIPDKCTKRQMLSYIAAANGQFGFIDRHGKYVRKWYGKSTKRIDNNTIDEPTVSEKPNKVIGIVCVIPSLTGDSSITLTVGNSDKTKGRVLEIENPYMTSSLLNSLFIKVNELSWYTSELKMRLGDPRLDLGDVITYKDIDAGILCDIPITELRFTYDGGLTADISAVGLNEEEQL